MSTKCTNRYRLYGVLAVVLLFAVTLHSTATAQVVQDVKTSTVTSGTVLDTSGTISANRGNATVGIGLGVSPPQPQAVRGTASAYFAGWGTYTNGGTSWITMSVAIDKARHVQKLILPNEKPNGLCNPGKEVKTLSKTLKIGDAVGFHYLKLPGRIYAAKIKLVKPLPKGSGAAPFTLIRSKTSRSTSQKTMLLTANAGVIPCTFRVAEEIGEDGEIRPSRKVTDALKKFCRSDLLELEYKTVDFKFILTGVKAAVRSGEGTLTKITSKKIKGYQHLATLIKTSKRTMTLIDPEAVIKLNLKNVSDATPDPPVQTALKNLAPGDRVKFRYRRQKGTYWLEEIYQISQPAAAIHPPKPAAGNK
ncbi:MAG: hypothetical protein GY794_00845 [bacterium]|nr:hypothetical protein [bacterium]